MQSICNTKWCTIITILQGPFHLLINCEKFSLSTNLISNIANLQSFKCLRILSMGRNTLKSLQGIEGAADTLEQLWISYNQIDRLKPIRNLLRLKVNQTHLKYSWFIFLIVTCLKDSSFSELTQQVFCNWKTRIHRWELYFYPKLSTYFLLNELRN